MKDEVIPFKTPNFGSFVATIVVFGFLGIFIPVCEPLRILAELIRLCLPCCIPWASIPRVGIPWVGKASRTQRDEENAGPRLIPLRSCITRLRHASDPRRVENDTSPSVIN